MSSSVYSYPEPTTVLRELDDAGVLLLTFNRPDRNNGWTIELEEEYFANLLAAGEDPAVRVVVVTGAGKSFCPGLDMQALEDSAKRGKAMASIRRYPLTLPWSIPKTVIAAVNGAAAGIGFIQVACSDLRFASSNAKFTTSFSRRGLPAENALSWLLPRLIGVTNAMDLLLSARVVAAGEALQLGLLNRVFEPDELLPATLAYARDLALNCSPFALASIKAQVHADLERGMEEARMTAIVQVSEHTRHPDFEEGVSSFTERRAPRFAGYSRHLDINRGWYR
ncbi:MAG: enoyl-CoA hydratase-related protein [Actinomycetota bacterium]|nr:enoyl-CoA hydratase-related protein [Actinomycetota bacterium]